MMVARPATSIRLPGPISKTLTGHSRPSSRSSRPGSGMRRSKKHKNSIVDTKEDARALRRKKEAEELAAQLPLPAFVQQASAAKCIR